MKKRAVISCIVLLCISVLLVSVQSSYSTNALSKNRDFVPDEKTAIKVAEAIWLPIYGDDIYTQRPFKAKLVNSNVWVVEGTMEKNMAGGVAYIEIRKKDCKVLKVSHGK